METSKLTQDYADSLSFIQSKISNRFRNTFIKKGCKEINGIFKQFKIMDLKDFALVYCLSNYSEQYAFRYLEHNYQNPFVLITPSFLYYLEIVIYLENYILYAVIFLFLSVL